MFILWASLLITLAVNAIQTLLFLTYGPRFTKRAILNDATIVVEDSGEDGTIRRTVKLSPEFERLLAGILHSPATAYAADQLITETGDYLKSVLVGKVGQLKRDAGKNGNLEFIQFIGEMLAKNKSGNGSANPLQSILPLGGAGSVGNNPGAPLG